MIAEHKQLGALRLIKKIKKASQFYGQLSNEAFLMKRLNHASIPQIFDLEEDEQFLYIIEQYIEGETLTSYCTKKVISEQELLCFGEQICEVVQYLHSQKPPIYHLDLKPDNLIISKAHIWLIDFGSAATQDRQGGVIFGTPLFASPEQKQGKRPNEQWDIYGIGVLLAYMAAGGRKSEIEPFLDWNITCNFKLKQIVKKCIHPKPFFRYREVSQIASALRDCKRTKKSEQKQKSFKIAVAGAKNRSGTTHISFLLCSFLAHSSSRVLYLEKNKSGMLQELAIRRRWEFTKQKKFPFCFHKEGFYLAKQSTEDFFGNLPEEVFQQFEWIVEDYGELGQADQAQFALADFRFVILGGREWEMTFLEDCLQMTMLSSSNTLYLFNLTKESQYRILVEQMGKRHCQRISYEPDPFCCGKETSSLFWNVLKGLTGGEKNV